MALLAPGVQFPAAFEDNSVIASVPKLALNAGVATAPEKASVSQTALMDEFSVALTQAIQTTNSTIVAPPQGEQAPEQIHPSLGQGKGGPKISPRASDDATSQKHSPQESEGANTLAQSYLSPAVSVEAPKPAVPKSTKAQVIAPVTMATGVSPSPASIAPKVIPSASLGTSDFIVRAVLPFVGTPFTTSSLAGIATPVTNASGSQPEGSSQEGPQRTPSTTFELCTGTIPADAATSATATDVNIIASNKATAPTSGNVSNDLDRTKNLQTETSSLASPAAHGGVPPKSSGALPTVKSAVLSPGNLGSITSEMAKTESRPQPALVPHTSVSDVVSGNQKPETHVSGVTPHVPAHNSVSSEDSGEQVPAAKTQLTVTKDSSPTPTLPVVSIPQVPNTKFEEPTRVESTPEESAKPSGVTTDPSQHSTKTVAAGDNSKPQSESGSSQSATSSAGGQTTIATQGNVAAKITDVFASNMTQQPVPVPHNKIDAGIPKNDVGLDKTVLHVPDADIAIDRQAAATAYPASPFQSAKLVERLGQSELRVGIQAGEFGNVDIRTSMARNQFTAEISVERGELSKVIAAELPSLQNRLSEQRLPVANIILHNQSSGGSAGFEHGSRQSQTLQQIATHHNSDEEGLPVAAVAAETNLATSRLDVHM